MDLHKMHVICTWCRWNAVDAVCI